MSLLGHDAALGGIQRPNFREIGKNVKKEILKLGWMPKKKGCQIFLEMPWNLFEKNVRASKNLVCPGGIQEPLQVTA